MQSKLKHFSRFFKNPAYVLVLLVSLAVVGTASAVAIKAFADGAPAGYELYYADHIYYLDGQAAKAKLVCNAVTKGDLRLTSDYVPGSPITADKLEDSNGTKLSTMDGFKDHLDELTYNVQNSYIDRYVYFSCTVGDTTYTTSDYDFDCNYESEYYNIDDTAIWFSDVVSNLYNNQYGGSELDWNDFSDALIANGKFWNANLGRDYSGSEKYSVGSDDDFTYLRVFSSIMRDSLYFTASYNSETQYGGEITLYYNSVNNFSYTKDKVYLPIPQNNSIASYDIVFYDSSDIEVNRATLPRDILLDVENDGTHILSIRYSSACLYQLNNEYSISGSSGHTAYLPMSVKMVYDYSNYPEKSSTATPNWGYTDVGSLLGSDNQISDVYTLSYGLPFVYESFTLAGTTQSPTFTPPNTEDKTCPTSYWVLKNHLDYNYSPGDDVQVYYAEEAGVLTTPAFDPDTGYYTCEFPVEPLFEDCYFTLTYHENYQYNWQGEKVAADGDNDGMEIYRYQYMDGNIPIVNPAMPVITVKSPESILNKWGSPGMANDHRHETFQYWTRENTMAIADFDGYAGDKYHANDTWTQETVKNINLYAQWDPKTYHITYHFQSPTGNDDDVTVKGNWYDGSSHNKEAFDGFEKELQLSVDKSKTSPAGAYTHSIIGYSVNEQYIEGRYYYNIKLECPGSNFKYWSLSPSGSQAYNIYDENYTLHADGEYYADVYAVWDGLTIQYNANGKSASNMPENEIIPLTKLDGDGYTLSTQVPTATNCVFKGWMLTSDGSDTITALTKAQASTQLGHAPAVGNTVTVYAKWEEAKTLTYHANEPDGTTYSGSVPETESFETGETATVKGNVGASGDGSDPLAITSYVFSGWNTAANGSGTDYAADDTITMNSNVNLYAKWTAITYRLTYQDNSTSLKSGVSVSGMPASPKNLTIADFTSESYTLETNLPTAFAYQCLGWGSSASITTADMTAVTVGNFTKVNDTLYECTVYAIWEKTPYVLHYNANKPDGMGDVTGSLDDTNLTIDQFEKVGENWIYSNLSRTLSTDGFTFKGWNPDSAATEKVDQLNVATTFTDTDNDGTYEATVYAVWNENAYQLHYDSNGHSAATGIPNNENDLVYCSSATTSKNVKDGKALSDSTPSDTGYRFTGWQLNDGTTLQPGGTVAFDKFKASSTVTATAQWETITNQVIYHVNTDVIGTDATVTNWLASGLDDYTADFNITDANLNAAKNQYTLLDPSPVPATTGYLFKGWSATGGEYTDQTKIEKIDVSFTSTAQTYEVYAMWEDFDYRLTYDLNGHTDAANQPYPNPSTHVFSDVRFNKVTISTNIPTVEGYTFTGWKIGTTDYTAADIMAAADPSATDEQKAKLKVPGTLFDNTTKNATAVAQWTENTYTLKYETNLPTGVTVENMPATLVTGITYSQVKDSSYPLSSNQPEATGYTFSGWRLNNSTETYDASDPIPCSYFNNNDKTVTATAQWGDVTYTLTYHDNKPDGTTLAGGAVPAPASYNYGAAATVKGNEGNMFITGYVFDGWNTKSDGTGEAKAQGDSITMYSDVDLYAQWLPITYKLTYNKNLSCDVSGMPAPAEKTLTITDFPSGSYTLATPLPTAFGYQCLGWGGTSTGTADRSTVTLSNFTKTNDTLYECTVYAIWAKNDYVLHYDAHQTDEMGNVDGVPDDQPLTIDNFTKEGDDWFYSGLGNTLTTDDFGFVGWNPSNTATEKVTRINVNEFSYNSGSGKYEATVYAVWQITLSYDKNGATVGTVPAPQTVTGVTDSRYLTTDLASNTTCGLVKALNDFTGWNTKADGTGIHYDDGATNRSFHKNTVLYAQWNPQYIQLTYNENGGRHKDDGGDVTSLMNALKKTSAPGVPLDTTIAAKPEKLVRDGYDFTGWNTAADGSGTGYTPNNSASFAETTVLYAQWKELTHTLKYDANAPDGVSVANLPEPVTDIPYSAVKDGNYTLSGTEPTADGYDFKGWLLNETSGIHEKGAKIPFENFDNSTRTATAKAIWEASQPVQPATYTVIYKDNHENYTDLQNPNAQSSGTVTGITPEQLSAGYALRGDTEATFPLSDNYRFMYWCTTPAYDYTKIITTATAADFQNDLDGKADTLTVYAHWVKKIEVTYQSETTQEDDNGNVEIVSAREAFKVNMEDLSYTVKSLAEIKQDRPDFDYPTDREFVKWRVVEGGEHIKIVATSGNGPANATPTSGGSLLPRRSGAGTTPIVTELMPGTHVLIHGDVVLMAVWNKYYVSYDKNGASEGTVPAEPKIYAVGSTVTVLANTGNLSRTGAPFNGWNTKADYTGTHYDATGSETFTMPEEDVVLYAQWKATPAPDPDPQPTPSGDNYFSVTYDPNGGTGTTPKDTNHYVGGETVAVASRGDLTKAGCTFKEWNTAKDGSGAGFIGDGTNTFTMPKSNVTLYAIWVDGDGNIVVPRTGEENLPLQIAFGAAIVSLLTVAFTVAKRRREGAKNA